MSQDVFALANDFILLVDLKTVNQAICMVEKWSEPEKLNSRAIMLGLIPNFSDKVDPSEIIFVVDR